MPLITPPFRTALLTANGVPLATDAGDIQTTRDWWMYWNQVTDRTNQLGDQVNQLGKLVSEGPHADRPAPESVPDGALYYESDRGVIYCNANPAGTAVWQYVAGTMWGTLVPDQRPTDLGVHDAGFDFRTVAPPPREFIWNQTAWVEIGGTITTQNVVTGSRALNTTYHNIGGSPLFVAVTATCTSGAGITAQTDAGTPPGTAVASASAPGTLTSTAALTFFVLPSYYYRITGSGVPGPTLSIWTEWQ
jgi:hypothetical protein